MLSKVEAPFPLIRKLKEDGCQAPSLCLLSLPFQGCKHSDNVEREATMKAITVTHYKTMRGRARALASQKNTMTLHKNHSLETCSTKNQMRAYVHSLYST